MDPAIPVILITAYGDINSAVNAVKQGAYYYIAKPFEHLLKRLVGPSEIVTRLVADIKCVATSNFSVLILREIGSDKELVVRPFLK